MSEQRSYISYAARIETPVADKTEVIRGVSHSIMRERQTGAPRYARTLCSSRATSTGLLQGEPQVLDGLSPMLTRESSVRLCTYTVTVPVSQVPGEVLSDTCPSASVRIGSSRP